MALICVASAGGSPGVTTTTLALTLLWPRPALLVDADPSGSSAVLAGHFRASREPTGGLISLALAQRDGTLAQALRNETLLLDDDAAAEHSAWFLPGIRSHEQAPSLMGLWDPLAEQLRQLDAVGQDVIVDCGRLGLVGWPQPLVAAADLTLLLTRNTLPAVAAARGWAKTLATEFAQIGGSSRLGALVIDESPRWPGVAGGRRVRPYAPKTVASTLQLRLVETLAWDSAVADTYAYGAPAPRKFESSGLHHSYVDTAQAISSLMATNREALDVTGGQA